MVRRGEPRRKRPRCRRLAVESLECRHLLSGVGLLGDANRDGLVNGLDVADVFSHWMQTGPVPLAGDANGDGIVNGLDVAAIASHWLQSASAPPSITLPIGTGTCSDVTDPPIHLASVADSSLLSTSDPVQVTFAAEHATLSVSTSVAGGVTSEQVSNNATGSVTVTATVAEINATLADTDGLLYAPANGYIGSDVVTATISDLGNTASGIPQTASTTLPFNVTGATPIQMPNLQLWLDPSDLSTLKLRNVADLDSTGNSMLQRAGVASDPANFSNSDGNGHTKMTVAFWVYFKSLVNDADIVGDSTGITNGSWALDFSSSGDHLRFLEFNGSTGAISDVIDSTTTTFSAGQWYFVALNFDGTQAAASRLHIWIGSVDTTDNGEQLVPQTLSGSATQTNFDQGGTSNPFWVGYSGALNYGNFRMADLTGWSSALTSSQVSTLWNNGEGVPDANLGSVGLSNDTFAYPMTETSGDRMDISAARFEPYAQRERDDGSRSRELDG